ncbi:ArsR/SmtB family transcription factor [Rhizobium rhizogenes]|jgi:DNA-binding transcriptional ArsR family regulator|uniref:ArsR/SmtB family transcription factor n=1 Tax=Rhizobium rhizogenes TaxID=359 RepID=UPI0009DEC405|nr:metalloregulator ArsR/SmtB family transcription factor [Rhizobium rhizogenes]NTF85343.1 winged helix-turn-helix transcriptional regulator [Rhizobium rhizogenes]NTI78168.1 winged helix-turn-helix transcriptional regulator [Rhizobium rhizogenes]
MNLAQAMEKKAGKATAFLSGLANEHRLLVLCQLLEGERNVTSLIEATNIPQTSMSQHLAKLKKEGIVDFRRNHRALYYFIKDPAVIEIMKVLYERFCR